MNHVLFPLSVGLVTLLLMAGRRCSCRCRQTQHHPLSRRGYGADGHIGHEVMKQHAQIGRIMPLAVLVLALNTTLCAQHPAGEDITQADGYSGHERRHNWLRDCRRFAVHPRESESKANE